MRDTRSLHIAFGDNANARCVTASEFALRSLNGVILRRGAPIGRCYECRRRTRRNRPN